MPVALVMGTSYLEDTTNLVKTEMTSQANHTLIACLSLAGKAVQDFRAREHIFDPKEKIHMAKPSNPLRSWLTWTVSVAMLCVATAAAAADKPNILVIWGDDIGYWNVSAYNQGMMGYKTPNIDRIAKEGMLFTDAYGEQSCTAGRAAFLTGQSGFRTGLLKVGLPGAKEGLVDRI